MRVFFGLDLNGREKLAIEQWSSRNLPTYSSAIPPANFHITLAFLGEVNNNQLISLYEAAGELHGNSFLLHIDQLGYWSKPRVLWIGPSQVPESLKELVSALANAGARLGIRKDNRPYMPHISLVRKVALNPPNALIAPDFELTFNRFHLFESKSTNKGVVYHPLHSWPLRSQSSVREQLRGGALD
ncbi:RNA 2',3'-cyclic phosphodiesterase [Aliiglaciecola sp. CAU 1673]|uniref:RNA 2',3'-cyclic phosphodiesterase n=1 Tax=Aliiglaciecola sp. CAU 1673 TaxID=3032595 RepID=UPI0023DC3020|nr:RNA 2',3'-cyclic phosphodiesterase [Aliiglaciecola sp. CAU 1673]MDF2178542.1 RNA 2',3'-cyclic phosphodiesterase [Aliiglaciecola sp. CAU 1673]